jgi:hypothetical protein
MTVQRLGRVHVPCSTDVRKAVGRTSLLWLALATFLLSVACGKTEQKLQPKRESAEALSLEEDVAAGNHGARAIAVSSASSNFPISGLNDGTGAPWGAADSQDDVWAAVVLPSAQAIREFRIWLFSPDQPPRPHLRDIRVVVADTEANGPNWRVVRSRLSTSRPFSERVTVPPGEDSTIVRVEIDPNDPNYGSHTIWGFACFARTKGDARNYLAPGTGNGIYVRELQMK